MQGGAEWLNLNLQRKRLRQRRQRKDADVEISQTYQQIRQMYQALLFGQVRW